MSEEIEIIRRAIEGDEDAYQKILNTYKGRVFSYVLRLVKNYDDAEEITFDVFIKCFRSLKNYEQSRPFATWLFTIAHNLVIDFFRKNKIEYEYIDEANPAGEDIEERYKEKRELERIEKALARLAPIDREIVILFHKEGYSYKELSEMLGLPITTLKTRLHRARKRLRVLLKSDR